MINAASRIEDLLIPPGNQLEALSGKKKGNTAYELTSSGAYALSG